MAFLDIVFPQTLCFLYESESAQAFATSIIATGGDTSERRVARWGDLGRRSFSPSVATMEREQVEELRTFFNIVLGRAYSFALEWPSDMTALDSTLLNTAGGTSFQLRKESRISYYRWDETEEETFISRFQPVRLCVPSSVYLTLNGEPIPVEENPDYNALWNEGVFGIGEDVTASVSRAGVVTLSDSILSTDELLASFNFHWMVRFDTDQFIERYRSHEAWAAALPMIETSDEVS